METITHCPVCGFDKFSIARHSSRDIYVFDCGRCGTFSMSRSCIVDADVQAKIAKVGYILSGLFRELTEFGNQDNPLLLTTNIEEFVKHYLVPDIKSIEEKIRKLLQHLREKTEYFGQEVELGDMETVVPLAYAKNSAELGALFTLINEKKLAKIGVTTNEKDDGIQRVRIALSANGWDITNFLEKGNKESDRGFIAIWFDKSMNEIINAIEEVIGESGFRPMCIKDERFSGTIMDKALGEIRQSRFVVVDLTGERGSIFFEAGFAHGLGIEVIYIYRDHGDVEKTPLEFYVRHYQCYKYKTPEDLKEILASAISARIKLNK